MNWKVLLAAVLVVAIVGLIMLTDIGSKYAEFLRFKVGNLVADVLNINKEPESQFQILITGNKEALFGQSYDVVNASLEAAGICQGPMVVGNTILQKSGLRCSVELDTIKGKMDYTAGGSIRVDGTASLIAVDDYSFTPSGESLVTRIEVIPVNGFLLSKFSQKKISTAALTGTIVRYKPDGNIKSTESLDGESLTISNFQGDIELSGDEIKVSGFASAVTSKTFNW